MCTETTETLEQWLDRMDREDPHGKRHKVTPACSADFVVNAHGKLMDVRHPEHPDFDHVAREMVASRTS